MCGRLHAYYGCSNCKKAYESTNRNKGVEKPCPKCRTMNSPFDEVSIFHIQNANNFGHNFKQSLNAFISDASRSFRSPEKCVQSVYDQDIEWWKFIEEGKWCQIKLLIIMWCECEFDRIKFHFVFQLESIFFLIRHVNKFWNELNNLNVEFHSLRSSEQRIKTSAFISLYR